MIELLQNPDFSVRNERDNSLLGAVGFSVEFYYNDDMPQLMETYARMTDMYLDFIRPQELNFYNNHSAWRTFDRRKMRRLFNKFNSTDDHGHWLNIAQLPHVVDEETGGTEADAELGPFGIWMAGINRHKGGSVSNSCTCYIRFDLPISFIADVGSSSIQDFVMALIKLRPPDSGHAGWTFQYSNQSDQQSEQRWISYQARRYLAIHPYQPNYSEYARDRVANVSWLTLLSKPLIERLGTLDRIRSSLSKSVSIKLVAECTVLMAGAAPPLGEVNAGAPDIGPLREVARLTRPLWIDDETLRNNILNYFWYDPDDSQRWIDRFEVPAD